MRDMHVKCDFCDWCIPIYIPSIKSLKIWYNQPCPKCRKGIIISDHDLRVFRLMRVLNRISIFLNRATFGWVKLYDVHMDTKIER